MNKLDNDNILHRDLKPNIILEDEPFYPKIYQDLIERCWLNDPNARPTFQDILLKLENDPEYLLEGVDKDEYFAYIKQTKQIPQKSFKFN